MCSFGQVDLFSHPVYLILFTLVFITLALEPEDFWGGELTLISVIPGLQNMPMSAIRYYPALKCR